VNRTNQIKPDDILLFCTQRNEQIRLPYFLDYYRKMGVGHFFIVDNDSDDGSAEYLAQQPDVSVWGARASYKRARFGADWLNWLQMKYAHGHWTLTVDPDESLIYPFCDTRPLRALTDWLDASAIKSFSAMLLDMYPKGPIGTNSPIKKARTRSKSHNGSTAATIRCSAISVLEICGFRAGRARGCSLRTILKRHLP